jgi:hypothetical protein
MRTFAPSTATGPPADVTGKWTGSAGTRGSRAPVTMSLKQAGSAVSGD